MAVVVTSVAVIATSSVWYIVFGKARIELLGKGPGASVDTTKPQPARSIDPVDPYARSERLAVK